MTLVVNLKVTGSKLEGDTGSKPNSLFTAFGSKLEGDWLSAWTYHLNTNLGGGKPEGDFGSKLEGDTGSKLYPLFMASGSEPEGDFGSKLEGDAGSKLDGDSKLEGGSGTKLEKQGG